MSFSRKAHTPLRGYGFGKGLSNLDMLRVESDDHFQKCLSILLGKFFAIDSISLPEFRKETVTRFSGLLGNNSERHVVLVNPLLDMPKHNVHFHSHLYPKRFQLGCPTSYSCHVDSVLLYSKFEAKRIKY